MNIAKEVAIFETNNVDLATFLIFEGIKLVECRRADNNRHVIMLRFLDDKQNCRDLERVFLSSDFKRFRDINKYLLAKVHEALRN